jgi:hypothetical protein
MSKTSLYAVTVPVMQKGINALSEILTKAEAWAKEAGKTEEELLALRLAPDMFPLGKQVQLVSDQAKAFVARIQGKDPVSMEDTEGSFAELRERLAKTLSILNDVKPEDIDSNEDSKVVIKFFPGKHILGYDYATTYILPNFFFHLTTAYGILRHAGLTIGKQDFMGGLPFHDDEAI